MRFSLRKTGRNGEKGNNAIATQFGFYFIVQKPADGVANPWPNVRPVHSDSSDERVFHVRTRCEMDLKNIVSLASFDAKIRHTTTGDYAWRIVVGQAEVNAIMSVLAHSIDYSNFKDRIHDLPEQAGNLSAYSQLWSRMLAFQSAERFN